MKKLSCKDMGMNCDFEAEGANEKEVMDKMMAHATRDHKEMMDGMSDKEKNRMMEKMREKMSEM